MTHEELVELLAAEVHAMWARWMAWVFTVSFPVDSGAMLIPAEDVRRWMRQVETPYAQLSFSEQQSDLREVRGYLLPIIERYLHEQSAAQIRARLDACANRALAQFDLPEEEGD